MESVRATFYLFGELVAEEEDLYDKRVKLLAILLFIGETGQ